MHRVAGVLYSIVAVLFAVTGAFILIAEWHRTLAALLFTAAFWLGSAICVRAASRSFQRTKLTRTSS